jgi:hypothetical protein
MSEKMLLVAALVVALVVWVFVAYPGLALHRPTICHGHVLVIRGK